MNILKKYLLLIKQRKNYLITHPGTYKEKINKDLLIIGNFKIHLK